MIFIDWYFQLLFNFYAHCSYKFYADDFSFHVRPIANAYTKLVVKKYCLWEVLGLYILTSNPAVGDWGVLSRGALERFLTNSIEVFICTWNKDYWLRCQNNYLRLVNLFFPQIHWKFWLKTFSTLDFFLFINTCRILWRMLPRPTCAR